MNYQSMSQSIVHIPIHCQAANFLLTLFKFHTLYSIKTILMASTQDFPSESQLIYKKSMCV